MKKETPSSYDDLEFLYFYGSIIEKDWFSIMNYSFKLETLSPIGGELRSPPNPLSEASGGRGRAPTPTEGTLSTERPLFQNSPLDCFGIHPLQRSERFGRRLRPPTKGAAFGNRKPLKRLDLNFDWLRTADSLT